MEFNSKEYNKKYHRDWQKRNPDKLKGYIDTLQFDGMKKIILKRDNYRCQICGIKEKDCNQEKERLCIHHYDEDKKNNGYWNLLTVCTACHRLIHLGFF